MAAENPAAPPDTLKNRLTWEVGAFILIRTLLNTAGRMVYTFLPVFGRGMGVDLRQLALAITLRSAGGAATPLLASVADSHGRKQGILFGLLIFLLGAGAMVVAPGFPAFTLSLLLMSLGNLTFIPAMQAYLGDRLPYARRGRILAFTEFGWSLAFIGGVPLIGLVIARWGWRAPFPLLFGLGLIAFIVLWRLLTDDGPEQTADRHFGRNLGRILTSRAALAGLGVAVALAASNEVVNLVYGAWIEGSFQLTTAALGAAAAVIGFAELGGEFLVTVVIDRLGKSRAMILGLMGNAAAVAILARAGGSLTGALAGLFCFYLSFEFLVVSSLPLMTEVLPEARATFMGAVIACMSLGRALGGLLSAPLFGGGLEANLVASLIFNLGAMLALWRLNRRGIV